MYDEEIYENHNDLFGPEINLEHIAAEVMGREIAKITTANADLSERVDQLLEVNVADLYSSAIGRIMSEFLGNTIEESVTVIQYILKGYRTKIQNLNSKNY